MIQRYGTEATLSFIDLETTGKPNERIVEICVTQITAAGEQKGPFTRRIRPLVPIHWYATKVHGIQDKDLAKEQTFAQRAPALAEFLRGTYLVAHGAPQCELPVLTREFRDAGIAWPFLEVIDTVSLARRVWPQAGTWKLSRLVEILGKKAETAHTARGDTLMLIEVWNEIYKKIGRRVLPEHQPTLH